MGKQQIPHLFLRKKLAILSHKLKITTSPPHAPTKKVCAPTQKDILFDRDIPSSESNKLTSLHVLHYSQSFSIDFSNDLGNFTTHQAFPKKKSAENSQGTSMSNSVGGTQTSSASIFNSCRHFSWRVNPREPTCPLKRAISKGKDRLPTTILQGTCLLLGEYAKTG